MQLHIIPHYSEQKIKPLLVDNVFPEFPFPEFPFPSLHRLIGLFASALRLCATQYLRRFCL